MRILLLDFDGVIHSYTSGWQGVDVIPDPPVPGAFAFIDAAREAGFDVQVYSSRSKEDKGIDAMVRWFDAHGRGDLCVDTLTFPTQKPPAFLTIDDRCIQFNGDWPNAESLHLFKPWNK